MKVYKVIRPLLFIVFLFACEDDESVCMHYEPSPDLDIYEYPLRPGMPGWADLQTGEEMYDVTQLPESVLQSITSRGLVETCYNYPLLINMIAWPTLQRGVEAIIGIFNGFQDLAQRPDGAKALLARYREIDVSCTGGLQLGPELGAYTLYNSLFESVLAQDIYLSKLSLQERHELLGLAIGNYAKKKKLGETYVIFDLKSTSILMARIMILEKDSSFQAEINKNPDLQLFVDEIELIGSTELLDVVHYYAILFKIS